MLRPKVSGLGFRVLSEGRAVVKCLAKFREEEDQHCSCLET